MPARDFDAIFYVKHAPDIRREDGLFHIGYDIGKNARFEVVLTPATFQKALRAARLASDEFHENTGKVVNVARGKRV